MMALTLRVTQSYRVARSLQVTVDGSEESNVDSTAVSSGSLLAVPEPSVSPALTRRYCPSSVSLHYEQTSMWSPLSVNQPTKLVAV